LPVQGTTTIGQTTYLTLTFQEYQYLDSTSAVVAVQTSTDLIHWTTPANSSMSAIGLSANNDYIMQASVPLANPGKQYIRLNVISP